jgi:hypothetical protein
MESRTIFTILKFLLRFPVGFKTAIHYTTAYTPKQPERKEKKEDT